ncbi:FAD-dependent oxidoreductase [Microcoleus sp. FACHB-68]|uniref:dihydrolipoyl dehydrogenase family protein n=1 Tax=Microcoleus sp. FACHB-68 TaxID=2692826 RepID=UPI00168A3C22|nr:FAD-dependent oxidoreductase [Microcoleus sp. FACHB-68]MBD1938554.1 FAD-dependent oxidoreductase [Microcoleus sp. FACHB-68]
MAVDYDLVIIGNTPAGFYAAAKAASLKARVALIAPEPLVNAGAHSKALTQISRTAQQMRAAHQFGIYCDTDEQISAAPQISVKLNEAMQWCAGIVSNLEAQQSPAVLASLGVDFIAGAGQFYPKPQLGFEVKDRRLRARAYLLATGTLSAIPDIDGLAATGYLTAETISQFANIKPQPQNLMVIGAEPTAIELAQTFVRLGKTVTLAVRSPYILPKEDPEAAQLIQAQLEAEGVRILTKTEVTQAKSIDGKKWVQAGNQAIEVDEILLAAGEQPNLDSLNLESVGVKWHLRGIELSEKLQTTNPRIFACGYNLAHLGNYEADIALKNALFLPVFKADYHGIPCGIFSDPQLARVGISEAQARSQYGKDVLVLRQYLKTIAGAQMLGETTGLCKIIVRGNGEILGASIVAPNAGELIYPIALAMRQKIKVEKLKLPAIWPSLSEITENTAAEWSRQRLSRNERLQDFLEGLFNWRRGRFK